MRRLKDRWSPRGGGRVHRLDSSATPTAYRHTPVVFIGALPRTATLAAGLSGL
ncbi:hypothetical protein ABZS86_30455 [Streptomyces sp. NPDC005355]|uniref:hypothetical protein n=1 Tax=Streptomyces sp. NPDC005355 TaxID=3157038 RepID=UPI0033AE07F1